ncbi:hypothetical protein HCJ66_11295 [Listeria sp. FSL L7-1582]|uniref:hypothetical protein n=1 Tax=Listeria portnoyi TaxID=2713504 RepID=UPI00164DBF8A|nr:hypothetical protein [Listeria portnoyi]MBC6310122.1 hypothetical protein [Listeria portnoyi]
MTNYEKEVQELLEIMQMKIEEAVCECDNRLIKISIGKTYNELSHALRANSPVFRGAEYNIACHYELSRRSKARQANELIR